MMSLTSAHQRQHGMTLVIVLCVVAFLSLIGYTMLFSVRVHARIADNSIRQTQAIYLARSAVEKSMAILNDSQLAEESGMDPWMDPAQFEPQTFGDGTFEVSYQDSESETGVAYGLEDEAGKVNLNTTTREQLLLLPNMTDALADCLIDWRDSDDTPSTFGAESDLYMALPQPYMAKNRNLGTLRELLLVAGYDNTVLYGEDTNKNGVLDPNEDDGDESEPLDDTDGILDEGILRYITVYSVDDNMQRDGSARVNIQTASAQQLMNAMEGLTREQADAIVQYRQQNQFQNIGNLLDVTSSSQGQNNNQQQQQDEQSGDQGNSQNNNSSGSDSGQSNGRNNRDSGRNSGSNESNSGRNQGGNNQGGNQSGGNPGGNPGGGGGNENNGRGNNDSGGGRGNQGQGNQDAGRNRNADGGSRRGGGSTDSSSAESSRGRRNPFNSGASEGSQQSFSRRGNNNNAQQSGDGRKMFTTDDLIRWGDAITVSSEQSIPGLINLNTAPLEVLMTVDGLSEEDIVQIGLMRGAESTPFKSVADLFNVSSMTEETFKLVSNKFTTKTNQFTVRAVGMLDDGRSRQQIEAVIERKDDTARILYWREG